MNLAMERMPDVAEVIAIDAIRAHAIQAAQSGKGTDMCGMYPGSRGYEIWMEAYRGNLNQGRAAK